MTSLKLVIGNKNYSSWSLRPWLLLKQAQIDFEEIRIPLYQADTQDNLARWSPSGLVPVLHHHDLVVHDSLAICEYINDIYPELQLWPENIKARAAARAVSAQMHSGFTALRSHMHMNCRKSLPGKGMNEEVRKDIDQILALWEQTRETYAINGSFLFGAFSIADAMYAPVVSRFNTYAVELDDCGQDYIQTVLGLDAMQQWYKDSALEEEVINHAEI